MAYYVEYLIITTYVEITIYYLVITTYYVEITTYCLREKNSSNAVQGFRNTVYMTFIYNFFFFLLWEILLGRETLQLLPNSNMTQYIFQ